MQRQIRHYKKQNRTARRKTPWLWVGACVTACLAPESPKAPIAATTPDSPTETKPGSGAVLGFFEPSWGDSSGADGRGGVKLLVNADKRLPLIASDFEATERGDALTKETPEWLLFHGAGKQSLAFDFEWVTTDSDKFYGKAWAGGGLAFNPAWAAIDASKARHLVLWGKSSIPDVELTIALHSASKARGKEATGSVNLSDHAADGPLDVTWRQFVIPLTAFPDVGQVDLSALQQVLFNLAGGYPENQRVQVSIDNVYLTSSDAAREISNLGYLLDQEGVHLTWDSTGEVTHYSIKVDGKEALKVPRGKTSVLLPTSALPASNKASVEVVAESSRTRSSAALELSLDTPKAKPATVSFGRPSHEISPYLLGTNWGTVDSVKDLGVTVRRWGGNRTTKYNWKQDADSAGSDWFYLNSAGVPKTTPEQNKRYFKFIQETRKLGADVNFCIPISDWIAKAHASPSERYCSFPTTLYPSQESTDGQGCGNGIHENGQKLWGNEPSRTMVKNSVALQREFVRTVVKHFGLAKDGGVKFYSMDNEPGLWMHTHRDTMPRGVSAKHLADLNLAYAKAVKSVDPSAKVIGFGAWGVMELAGSSVDYMPPGPEGYKREAKNASERYRERNSRGGDSQLVYLLKRFKQAEAQAGQRLIDAIDVHWYPELYARDSQGKRERVLVDRAYDQKLAIAQWESLREWWDPSFQPAPLFESWTHGENRKYLWEPYHPVIPALTAILKQHYPGTQLAINEFDTGSRSHYHGALLRAATLGIFMQENLYMAQPWYESEPSQYLYFAHKLYGNYDGKGARVGGRFVSTRSSNEHLLSYAAVDGARYYLVLINKRHDQPLDAQLELPDGAGTLTTYTLAETLGRRLFERRPERTKSLRLRLQPYSATLLVLE